MATDIVCPYCRTAVAADAKRCPACTSWLRQGAFREWTRPHEGDMIAGVARGIANALQIPVALVRALFLFSLLLGGGGLIAYVVLWIAMPREERRATQLTPPPIGEHHSL